MPNADVLLCSSFSVAVLQALNFRVQSPSYLSYGKPSVISKLLPGCDRQDVFNAVLNPIPHQTRLRMIFGLIQSLQWVCACLETWMPFNRPHKFFLFLLRGTSACVMCRKQMVRILLAAIRAYVRQVGAKRWTYWMRCKVQLWLLGVKGQMQDGCDTRYLVIFPVTWQLHLVNCRLCRYERKTCRI